MSPSIPQEAQGDGGVYVNRQLLVTSIYALGALISILLFRRIFYQRPFPKEKFLWYTKPDKNLVPFIVLEEPSWRDLSVMLENYHREASNILHGLSRSLELAIHSERELFASQQKSEGDFPAITFSDLIEEKILKCADCLEENERTLEKLLRPFSVTKALPMDAEDEVFYRTMSSKGKYKHEHTHHAFTRANAFMNASKSNAYDSGEQVVAHLVRDWTILGDTVRDSLYGWCVTKLYEQRNALPSSSNQPILVPGSGLGRLAFDLANVGFSVEANELSLTMTAAAHAVLARFSNGTFYPFAMDLFSNEVHSDHRFKSIQFPDLDVQQRIQTMKGSLSYTVGEFVKLYRFHRYKEHYGGIVTCFFLDTATNIYEYLAIIAHILAEGAVWVNVGPLKWHQNALLHPSADELLIMIEGLGFNIVTWSVDVKPVQYRNEDSPGSIVQSTAFDAYRPLRFVAIRTSNDKRNS